MIRTGAQYLDSIRDGRRIYIGDELVTDPTTHPAFRNIARTFAAWYDLKADPANLDVTTYEEGGERYSMHFLRPRSREDLTRRTEAHRLLTGSVYGLLGRPPDAVGGNITGLTMNLSVFEENEGLYPETLMSVWEHLRKNDIYATYAVLPPQGARDPSFYESAGLPIPSLRVTSEDADGVTLNGMKMLATGAAIANEVLVGNLLPIGPDQKAEAITCVIPLNTEGLELWARPPFAPDVAAEFDKPLTWRYDESDCMLVFKDVKVPWEKIILHNNAEMSRGIYVQTPSHRTANHQSTVRFAAKLRFLLAMASMVTEATGARKIPAVRELLGRLAAMEAGYQAMVEAQHLCGEELDHGYWCVNSRYLYAALHWAMENHSSVLDIIRELMGGGMFQMPATISVMKDARLRETFETYWATGTYSAVERMKLFKLAWDLIGSEHASRATSYEKFFIGPAFSVRNYNFVNAPWDELHGMVEGLMASYGVPEDYLAKAAE